MIEIEIDSSSGFCFGVVNAIQKAEKELDEGRAISSLGPIVHNNEEVKRLAIKGLAHIDEEQFEHLSPGARVLFRAHGAPPSTYKKAEALGIELVDATCPVVLQLQKRIRKTYEKAKKENAQIAIFGKKGHAEVIGLMGQTDDNAILIESPAQLPTDLDLGKRTYLFSQTTMNREDYTVLIQNIEQSLKEGGSLKHYDTICRQVSNRIPEITEFAKHKDWIYFVAGKNSSNGKVLYQTALNANPNTHFISHAEEITAPLPSWVQTVGICGATSTPRWQMEEVKSRIHQINSTPILPDHEALTDD